MDVAFEPSELLTPSILYDNTHVVYETIENKIIRNDEDKTESLQQASIAASKYDAVRKSQKLKASTAYSHQTVNSSSPLKRTPRKAPSVTTPKHTSTPHSRQPVNSESSLKPVSKEQQRKVFQSLKSKIKALEHELDQTRLASTNSLEETRNQIQTLQEIVQSKEQRIKAQSSLVGSEASNVEDGGVSNAVIQQLLEKQATEMAELRAMLTNQPQSKSADDAPQSGVDEHAIVEAHSLEHQSTQTFESTEEFLSRKKLDRLLILLTDVTQTIFASLESLIPKSQMQNQLPNSDSERITFVTAGFNRMKEIIHKLTYDCSQLTASKIRLQKDFECATLVMEELHVRIEKQQSHIRSQEAVLKELGDEIERKKRQAETITKWVTQRELEVERRLSLMADKKVQILLSGSQSDGENNRNASESHVRSGHPSPRKLPDPHLS